MLLKQNHLIGLDIGSRSIKVADIVQGSNGLALKHFGMEPLPADTISDGVIEEPGVVVAAIRRLIADLKIKEKKVAISVSGYSVIIKKIVLAKMSEEELSQSIQFEAEQYIPFDVQDVNIDFHILGDSDQNPNQMNVMLVAAKKGVVDVYLDILTRSGLIPAVIDVDAFALENAFETNYLFEDGETMLVDIGANQMNISVLKEGVSAVTRDVAMGGEQITREIASEFDLSFEEAETAKLGTPNDKVSPDALEHIRTRCVSQWCNEVRRAIDFFYSTYSDSEIKRIFLSGGAARTEGLIELLAVETSVDVELFNPFNELSIEVKHPDPDLQSVAPQAAICVGLALRRMDDK